MNQDWRTRFLHVRNRLEELRSKHGLEDQDTPAWLDHYPQTDQEWADLRGEVLPKLLEPTDRVRRTWERG